MNDDFARRRINVGQFASLSRQAASGPRSIALTSIGHILLAEDNPISQVVSRAMVETLGFHVDVVANGSEAVRAATSSAYQAILMDCQMPLLDGYQATREIRRIEGAKRRTPILAITALPARSASRHCLATGMDDFVTKPLSIEALAGVLRRWTSCTTGPGISIHPTTPSGVEGDVVATPSTWAVLDLNVLNRLGGLGRARGEDLADRLTALFYTDAVAQLVAMHQALASSDCGAMVLSAHILGGSGADLGAVLLSRLCVTLATDAHEGDLVDAKMQLEAIEGEIGRVRIALAAWSTTR